MQPSQGSSTETETARPPPKTSSGKKPSIAVQYHTFAVQKTTIAVRKITIAVQKTTIAVQSIIEAAGQGLGLGEGHQPF